MTPEQVHAIVTRSNDESPVVFERSEDECYMDLRQCANDLSHIDLLKMSLSQALHQGSVYRRIISIAVRGAFLCEQRANELSANGSG